MAHGRLLLFSPLYPPHIGGLESHAEQFNKYMTKAGYNITVFTPLVVHGSAWRENCDGVKIIRFPAFEIIPNYPLPKFWQPFFWTQWQQIWQQDFEMIISRTRFFFTSLMALVFSKTKHTPWLHIEHGSGYVQLNNPLTSTIARIYDLIFGRLVFLFATSVVANSLATRLFIRRFTKRKDISVIYRGVEYEKIANISADKSLLNKCAGRIIVTYVGRIIDGKNVASLLNSLAQLKQYNLVGVIVGGGPQMPQIMRLIKDNDLSDSVIIYDHTEWPDAVAIIKASDIIVNPSLTEGMPTSVIEAAFCKKAIIATDVGGTAEIAPKGMLLIPANDDVALTRALRNLIINRQLRHDLGESAFTEVQDKFNWNRAIKQYEEIFDCLYNKI